MLTEKDKEMLSLIERWGYMSAVDLCKFLDRSNNAVVVRLKKLLNYELIKKVRYGYSFQYLALNKKRIDIINFEHDKIAKYLALYLSKKYMCGYNTLYELRSEAKIHEGITGLTKKIPDFILVKDGKKIAVEVELSQKPLKRQRLIIDKYIYILHNKEYMQVLYYCASQAIYDRIQLITKEKNISEYIKCHLLPEEIKNA